MYVHSAWLQTSASLDRLNTFTDELGEPVPQGGTDIREGPGVLFRAVEFADQHETGWESSTTTGAWRVAVAVLPSVDSEADGERMVGLLASAPALLAGLMSDLEESLGTDGAAAERVQFPLRPLLSAAATEAGVVPRSVRLRSDRTRTLVQSDDEQALRDQAAAVEGDVVGVTVEAAQQRVTVLEDGSVIFSDSASSDDVLAAMRSIQLATQVPAPVAWA